MDRRKVIWIHYLAAIAMAGFGSAIWVHWRDECLSKLAASGFIFERPEFLSALLIIPLMLAIRAHTLSDFPRFQDALSFFFRSTLVFAVVVALTGLYGIEQEPMGVSTVYVVDVSESIPDESLRRTKAHFQEIWRQRGEHEVRLVVFGGEAKEIELQSHEKGALDEIPRLHGEAARSTDIQNALRFAYSLLPAQRLKRLVLVTDGLETRGQALGALPTAHRCQVRIHHLDFSDVERPAELLVQHVKAPEDLKRNIPFAVEVDVYASQGMDAHCELKIDDILASGTDVTLKTGVQSLVLQGKVRQGGDHQLVVECLPKLPSQDRFSTNNRYAIAVRVPAKPKLLYVEGERRFRRNLLVALNQDFDVEFRGPRGMPASLSDANQYDLIFVSDVPRTGATLSENVSNRHMKVLQKYVSAGGGLIWSGGEDSFGPGGYGGTRLERKVLPLWLDVQKKEDIPSLALVLVVDRSGSMSGPKLELAKEAARATLEVLQPSDKLGVIAFDSAPITVVRLQRAANRWKITESLRRLSPGGGTNIFPALDQAYHSLMAAEAKLKHIILLTDGQSNHAGILDLVAEAYREKITISTVAVGLGSDQGLLMQMAEEGGGRYYFTDRADNIPKLFLKETSELSRRALVEDRFRPRVAKRFRGLQMFKGLDLRHAPPLLGYVSTRPKAKAEVLMLSHLGEPILARWRLGMGKVLAWTSDVKNKWAHYWLKWPGYAQFWRQVIRDTLRVETEAPVFPMQADIASGMLSIDIDAVGSDDDFIDGLQGSVQVTAPDGTVSEMSLRQQAPGRYVADCQLSQFGPYTIEGHLHSPDTKESEHRAFTTIAWPFPDEHRHGQPMLSSVAALSKATGGVVSPTAANLFHNEGKTVDRQIPLWSFPLYLALLCLFVDVFLRRVRLYGQTTLSWEEVHAPSKGRRRVLGA